MFISNLDKSCRITDNKSLLLKKFVGRNIECSHLKSQVIILWICRRNWQYNNSMNFVLEIFTILIKIITCDFRWLHSIFLPTNFFNNKLLLSVILQLLSKLLRAYFEFLYRNTFIFSFSLIRRTIVKKMYSLFGDSENRENNYLKIRELLSIALFNILGSHYVIHIWKNCQQGTSPYKGLMWPAVINCL
jgi:hypothetical protein